MLGDVRDVDCVELQNAEERAVQGGLRAAPGGLAVSFRLIQAVFDELEVIVAEVVPEKRVDLPARGARLVGAEQGGGFFCRFRAPGEHPAVGGQSGRRAVRRVIGELCENEFRGVPQLCEEPLCAVELLFGKERVGAELRAGGPVAQGVRRMFLNERGGVERVALRLAHFLAGLREDEAADHQVLPRQIPGVIQAADNRVKRPRADDLVRLRAHRHRQRRQAVLRVDERREA